MKSGTTYYITDPNVRRLRQLQDAAADAFSAHVSQHRKEVAAHDRYFQERFPILRKTVLDDRPLTASQEMEPDPPETKLSETETQTERTAPPADPDILSSQQIGRPDRRYLRRVRRQKIMPRPHPPAPAPRPPRSESSPSDIMTHSSLPPETAQTPDEFSAEELKVLNEIEKFERLQMSRRRPLQIEAGPLQRTDQPKRSAISKKRNPDRFSLRSLFDLSPQFRNSDEEG